MSIETRQELHSQGRCIDCHCRTLRPATWPWECRRRQPLPCARLGNSAVINFFGSARRADVARIDRFHWSAWITSVLVSHASRARFLCSEDLIIVALFLWLG